LKAKFARETAKERTAPTLTNLLFFSPKQIRKKTIFGGQRITIVFKKAIELFEPIADTTDVVNQQIANELDFLFIGELAILLGVNPKTIRYYESEGLLTPLRHGKFRTYRRVDVGRLKLIISLRRLGVSIANIKSLSLVNEEEDSMKLIEDTLKSHAEFLVSQLKLIDTQLRETQKILLQFNS
jgi:DNA-binding transcriptional MerR regulator